MSYAPAMTATTQVRRALAGRSYLFSVLLLIIVVAINYALQPNMFRPASLSGNLRTYLPLMLLAAGQAIIVIGGGIDLSIGAIVSLVNVIIVRALGVDPSPGRIALAIALGLLAGTLAGAFNGLCAAYLRFQPIITTFATSFVFSGLALWVLPSPGGVVPPDLLRAYAANPLRIPLAIWVAALVLLLWGALRATRFGTYLYAVGGQPLSAYVTGVPVSLVRLASYSIGGLLAACGSLALTLNTGTGDPLVGGPMTLPSVVAVVIGGTRLSGGQGGIAGALIGVVVLRLLDSIISFANVPSWWQTFAQGMIVMVALAGPGLVALVRGQRP